MATQTEYLSLVKPDPSDAADVAVLNANADLIDAAVKNMCDRIYPVGSIYMSVSSADPGTLFGGTWSRIEDTFLLAAGSTYAAGDTGGEATHKLTADELPKLAGTLNLRSRAGNADVVSYSSGAFSASAQTAPSALSSVGSGSNFTTYQQVKFAAGNDQAHNNMPPYLAVYCWQRTA